MIADFNDPHLQASFPQGPPPGNHFRIDASYTAPDDHGVGATFIDVGPQIGPALPAIGYVQPVMPSDDHFPGVVNAVPVDSIYGW